MTGKLTAEAMGVAVIIPNILTANYNQVNFRMLGWLAENRLTDDSEVVIESIPVEYA